MNKRKKLSEIQAAFDRDSSQDIEENTQDEKEGSLSASLKIPKKQHRKIRFTLDLEKPLDDRLNKAASKLNRSKAELVPPVNFSLMANQARERQSSLAQNLDRAETLIWNKLLARDF